MLNFKLNTLESINYIFNSMNILQWGKFHENKYCGGIEAYVTELSSDLAKKHTLVNLVANTDFSSFSEKFNAYEVKQAASLGRFLSTSFCPTMPYLAHQLNKKYRFDLMHLHFPDPMSHFSSLFLPKSVKRIISWHSDIVKQKLALKAYEPFLKKIVNMADAIIINNPHPGSFPQLQKLLLDKKKINIIPTGIDTQRFLEVNQNEVIDLQKKYQKPIIFALGRHVYYKGFEYLIEAMKYIEDAVLIIGGEGPLTSDLQKQIIDSQLSTKVFLTGKIPHAEIINYYHAAEIFCFPSIEASEAYGLAQLEAMACGKPVVCCELNNGVNFVNQHEKTGLAVPPKNPKALANALISLLTNDTYRQSLGEYAQKRVINEFDFSKTTKNTINLYEKILKT